MAHRHRKRKPQRRLTQGSRLGRFLQRPLRQCRNNHLRRPQPRTAPGHSLCGRWSNDFRNLMKPDERAFEFGASVSKSCILAPAWSNCCLRAGFVFQAPLLRAWWLWGFRVTHGPVQKGSICSTKPTFQTLSARQVRWQSFLSEYNIEIAYIPATSICRWTLPQRLCVVAAIAPYDSWLPKISEAVRPPSKQAKVQCPELVQKHCQVHLAHLQAAEFTYLRVCASVSHEIRTSVQYTHALY